MIRKRWRRCRRRLRMWAGARKNREEVLREFVYLDETSVYSLIVSRVGPVAAEFTDTQSSSLRHEASDSFGVAARILNSKASTGIEQKRETTSQVVRRAMIQSTFRDLRKYEDSRLVIGPPLSRTRHARKAVTKGELLLKAEALREERLAFGVSDLRRGQLFEMDIVLGAEEIYRLSTAMGSALEFVDAFPDMIDSDAREGIELGQSAVRMFDKMQVGLVPVRGRAVDYRAIDVDGRVLIVHSDLLARLPAELREAANDLYVVGVAEVGLFWKDMRRVLFSNSCFTVLARVGRDGLSNTWTPAKLEDALGEFFPPMVLALRGLVSSAREVMASESAPETEMRSSLVRSACACFVKALSAEMGREMSSADAEPGLPSLARCAAANDVAELRALFESVTKFVERVVGESAPRGRAGILRDSELARVGIGPDGVLELESEEIREAPIPPSRREYLLDSEIVAIYW